MCVCASLCLVVFFCASSREGSARCAESESEDIIRTQVEEKATSIERPLDRACIGRSSYVVRAVVRRAIAREREREREPRKERAHGSRAVIRTVR